MSKNWFQRVPRPVWMIGAVVGVLALVMVFAPLRAVANSFLGLFRVQQIQMVQVNSGKLPEQLGSSAQFEAMFTQDVQVQNPGEQQQVSSATEAGNLAGFNVRLPQTIQGQPILAVQPGGSARMIVNAAHVRALLAEIDRSDIQIPDHIDGAEINIQIPTGVMAQYGECKLDAETLRKQGFDPDEQGAVRMPKCTTLLQVPSPTITAPAEIDVQKIGEAYLQVMGMSQSEAEQFARNVDWATTFIVPIPRYASEIKEVAVDGVMGTLVLHYEAGQYLLMWVKDGNVYALTGPGDEKTALEIASSLK